VGRPVNVEILADFLAGLVEFPVNREEMIWGVLEVDWAGPVALEGPAIDCLSIDGRGIRATGAGAGLATGAGRGLGA
jgi:hypothetical protein